MCVVVFCLNSEGKGRLVLGGQGALCAVCDRGASQLSPAATDTGVRVHFHIHHV